MLFLLISSELEELVRNCDRIAVIRDGKKIAEMNNTKDLTEEKILEIIAHDHEAESNREGIN